jgi:hypothetical protein
LAPGGDGLRAEGPAHGVRGVSGSSAAGKRCARSGRTFPPTEEFWYTYRSWPHAGTPTGYCRPCHKAYCREYAAALTGEALARRRLRQRDSARRVNRSDPDRFRLSKYEWTAPPCVRCGSHRTAVVRTRRMKDEVLVCFTCCARMPTQQEAG